MNQIGFIGAGQMATALAGGIANSTPHCTFHFYDPSETAASRFREVVGENGEVQSCETGQHVVDRSDVVFLAVKPDYVAAATKHLEFSSNPLVISIAGGVDFPDLENFLGIKRIVRVMPNTPCLISSGAMGYARSGSQDGASDADIAIAKSLIQSVGVAVEVPHHLIDAVTGLSGSGPAYVFTFVEALIDGGVLAGMPRDVARELAIQTVLGSVEMIRMTGSHPGVLRDQVTSPGGTTIAAVKELEAKGFRDATMSAVIAATNRAKELG